MRTAKAIRRDSAAVSPVIATILMVAITVVLAAVLYVMVTGLIQNPGQTPQQIGVNLTSSGENWRLTVSNAPSKPLISDVTLVLIDPDDNLLSSAPLSDNSVLNVTFNDVIDDDGDPTDTPVLDAGDYISIGKNPYISGTQYQLIVGGSVAASGTLR